MSSLETRYEVRVRNGQPSVQEDDRHAVWLWKRFQPSEDGLSRYYRQCQRWNFRSKWGYGVMLKRSVAVDSHVTGTCFLVRSVRRMTSRSRHENPVFQSMRDTPARLARGGSAEAPHGDVETPPPTVEAKERNSQLVKAMPPIKNRGGGAPNERNNIIQNRATNDTEQVNRSSNKFQCHRVERWRACRETCRIHHRG